MNARLIRKANVLVVVLMVASAWCNVRAQQMNTDSLWKVLRSAVHDSVRIKALNGLSWDLYWTQPDSAYVLAMQAAGLARKLDDKRGLSSALNNLGLACWKKRQYPEAMEYHRKSLTISQYLEDSTGIAHSLNNMGLVFEARGERKESLTFFERSIAIHERLGNRHWVRNGLRLVARVYSELNRHSDALRTWRRCTALCVEDGDTKMAGWDQIGSVYSLMALDSLEQAESLALCALKRFGEVSDSAGTSGALDVLGNCAARRGRYGRAMEYLLRALRLARASGAKETVASSLLNLGMIHYRQGAYKRASECYNESIEIYEKIDDLYGVLLCTNAIGALYRDQGDHERALEHFHAAYKVAEQLRYPGPLGTCLMNLGTIYQGSGKNTEALRFYLEALKYYSSADFSQGLPWLHINLGTLYIEKCAYRKALKHFQESLRISRKSGMRLEEAGSLAKIAAAYTNLGSYDTALVHYQQSLETFHLLGSKAGMAEAIKGIGNVLRKTGKYSDALEYLQRALDIARIMGDMHLLARIMCDLGFSYHRSGKSETALTLMKEALEIAEKCQLAEVITCILSRKHMIHAEMGNYFEAYQSHRTLMMHLDTMRQSNENRQLQELMQKYEAEQREHRIELLEQTRKLQSFQIQSRDEALHRRQLEARERLQQIELLSRASEIQLLEMSLTEANLRSREAESMRRQQKIELLERDRSLQAAGLAQETSLRNSAIAGAVLILLLSALLVRHLRQRRRMSELRAVAAEVKAHEAELTSLRVMAEAERKETEIQRLFSHRLIDSQEQERSRIARDLHDSLGQKLAVIRSRAQLALSNDETAQDPRALISELSDSTHDILQEIRSISHDLHPPVLDTFGLAKALQDMTRELEAVSDTEWELDVDSAAEDLDTRRQLTLYRILQEAANNVIRHAGARHAWIRISERESHLHVSVEDDGHGFDVEGGSGQGGGLGLRSMRERVHMLGGNMTIVSRERSGTKLLIEMPVAPEEQREHIDGIRHPEEVRS
ncbi:MAG: tetratricopeptide repeat protein [Bacteroidetes bacterium]|nr:tetratricopeptide repeat protein [Bacteroidota bacterium]